MVKDGDSVVYTGAEPQIAATGDQGHVLASDDLNAHVRFASRGDAVFLVPLTDLAPDPGSIKVHLANTLGYDAQDDADGEDQEWFVPSLAEEVVSFAAERVAERTGTLLLGGLIGDDRSDRINKGVSAVLHEALTVLEDDDADNE